MFVVFHSADFRKPNMASIVPRNRLCGGGWGRGITARRVGFFFVVKRSESTGAWRKDVKELNLSMKETDKPTNKENRSYVTQKQYTSGVSV